MYLSRGNDPGYEFVFTLTGATVGDSGMYKVEVDVIHPRTISHDSIIKMFYLNVSEPVAPAAETTVDTTVTPTSTDHSSSEETPSTNGEWICADPHQSLSSMVCAYEFNLLPQKKLLWYACVSFCVADNLMNMTYFHD